MIIPKTSQQESMCIVLAARCSASHPFVSCHTSQVTLIGPDVGPGALKAALEMMAGCASIKNLGLYGCSVGDEVSKKVLTLWARRFSLDFCLFVYQGKHALSCDPRHAVLMSSLLANKPLLVATELTDISTWSQVGLAVSHHY